MKLDLSKKATIVQEGFHIATIHSVSPGKPISTAFAQSDTVLITFKLNETNMLTQSLLTAPGANALLVKLVSIAMGTDTGEVDLNDLVGKRIGIEVKHRHGQQDRLFVNVVDFCLPEELIDEDSEDWSAPIQDEELSIFGDADI